MNAINELAVRWWEWMVPMFWQVALVAAVVAVIDRALERKVWPQVRYALWILVFVKLVLPPWFSSPLSVTAALFERESASSNFLGSHAVEAPAATSGMVPSVTGEPVDTVSIAPGVAISQLGARVEPGIEITWQTHLMAVWLLGAMVLAIWAAGSYRRLRREFNANDEAAAPPESFRKLVQSVASSLRLTRIPKIVFSDEVCSPAVFGLFRPVLVMPGEHRDREPDETTRHLVLHELAHIKRGDLLLQGLVVCLQILYWFHPLLWFAQRRLREAREICCDATVAGILKEETDAYRATLLGTAERLLLQKQRFSLGFLGLIERPCGLTARLGWLERKVWRRRRLRVAAVFATVAAMFVLVLPMARSRAEDTAALDGGEVIRLLKVKDREFFSSYTVEARTTRDYLSVFGDEWRFISTGDGDRQALLCERKPYAEEHTHVPDVYWSGMHAEKGGPVPPKVVAYCCREVRIFDGDTHKARYEWWWMSIAEDRKIEKMGSHPPRLEHVDRQNLKRVYERIFPLGRGFGQLLEETISCEVDADGIAALKAKGNLFGLKEGSWELRIDTKAAYLVQSATYVSRNSSLVYAYQSNGEVLWDEERDLPIYSGGTFTRGDSGEVWVDKYERSPRKELIEEVVRKVNDTSGTDTAAGDEGSEDTRSRPREREEVRPRTLAEFEMSSEVLETWNIVLEAAGMEGAMAEIAVPGELKERDWTPFKVWLVRPKNLRGRKFYITMNPETGELIQWSELTSSEGKKEPTRDVEEVQKRIEDLAARLLPSASERKLIRGPEYIERNGQWFAAWKRTMDGIPFELDGCSIEVADEDLSLRGYGVHYYSTPPADMTVVIDVEQAKRLATEAMVDLQKRKIRALRESAEPGLDEQPVPEVKTDVCLEPELLIVPYDPGYFELERSRDARNVRAEMRLAWDVRMNVLVAREDGCWNVYGDKLWIDAQTGEVVGGDHLLCLKEHCPAEGEEATAAVGCWW